MTTDNPPNIDWEGVLPGPGGFGMARLKTEGEPQAYDPGAIPGLPLTRAERLQLKLEALGDRLRAIPSRLWWALFGSGDW